MRAIGFIILLVFYSVYIGKMVLQRRQGIQTDQIAKGTRRDKVFYIELIMKAATNSVVIIEVISIVSVKPAVPSYVRFVGMILGFVGDVVFALAVITMKDNWRAGIAENDKTEMVTAGIYRFSRNPAFLGFGDNADVFQLRAAFGFCLCSCYASFADLAGREISAAGFWGIIFDIL